jgi:rod shape-determining protein MreC
VALGTLDRSPPPFFKQGPSALTRLLFFSSLAVFLMVADQRFKLTQPARAVIATVLQPMQQGLLIPVNLWNQAGQYLMGLESALLARDAAERRMATQAAQVMRAYQLASENLRLRGLLALRPQIPVDTQAAEALYDAPDPFTRKVVIDRGSNHQVVAGSPVMDEHGVLGQVTRVYPLTSEVTLVTDRDAAVPVIVARTQQRGVAYGWPESSGMELRFMAGNADVQVGDALHTSGLDGVYPPGLPVARVIRVDRRADSAFARIVLTTLAKPDDPHHVLVLKPISDHLPVPQHHASGNSAWATAPSAAAASTASGTVGLRALDAPSGASRP